MNIQKMVLVPVEKYERMKLCKREETKVPQGPTTIVEEAEDTIINSQSGLQKERILETLPKVYKNKGAALLSYIENGKALSWNDKGEIIHRGNTVENSHIADLLKDAMRDYKDFDPVGKKEFYEGLSQSNVPLLLLENKQNRKRVMEEQGKPAAVVLKHHQQPKVHKWIHI